MKEKGLKRSSLDVATMNPLEPLGEAVSVEGGRSQAADLTEERRWHR